MQEIIFATGNPNKVREVQEILGDQWAIKSLKDIGCTEEVPETTDTIEGNASQKANYVSKHYEVNCFSEDTGLEVAALDGAPGVHTAYYAGPQRSAKDNIKLLLNKLEGQSNRKARFKTVISLIINGKETLFTGIVNGRIAMEPQGTGGFGYDPIFIPDGYEQSFAELSKEIKNTISHRARAMSKLLDHLAQISE